VVMVVVVVLMGGVRVIQGLFTKRILTLQG
jgi:hypothetical protein